MSGIAAATAAILLFKSFTGSLLTSTADTVMRGVYGHYEISLADYRAGKVDDPFGYQIHDYDRLKSRIAAEVGPLAFISRRQEFYGLLNFNDHSVGGVGTGIDAAEERKFLTLAVVKTGVHLADAPDRSLFIGSGLAEALRAKVGDVVTVLVTTAQGSVNAADLTIAGTFTTGAPDLDDRTYYVHHALAEELLHTKGAPRILLAFTAKDELALGPKLEALLAREFPGMRAAHWRERATFYANQVNWMKAQMEVFYAIILAIATISILSIFSMGLLERVGEFGTLRAIGTARAEIVALIFVESMVQALVGSVLGLVVALALIVGPLRQGILMPPLPMMSLPFRVLFAVPWSDIVPTVLLCAGVAGMSGIFPALRVARVNIVAALGRNV